MRVTLVAYKLEQSIMSQKMCFGIICVNYAVRMEWKILYFPLFFSQKIHEIPYSHNVKVIGNNSGSIKDRAVKFV